MKTVVVLALLFLWVDGGTRSFSETPATPAAQPAQLVVIEKPKINLEASIKRQVKGALLDRIEQMVGIDAPKDDRCYKRIVKADKLGLVVKVPFASDGRALSQPQLEQLIAALDQPPIKNWRDDPTVTVLVLGFADSSKDYYDNIALSKERADSILKLLREKIGGQHVIFSIPMGSARLLDTEQPLGEYTGEIWALW